MIRNGQLRSKLILLIACLVLPIAYVFSTSTAIASQQSPSFFQQDDTTDNNDDKDDDIDNDDQPEPGDASKSKKKKKKASPKKKKKSEDTGSDVEPQDEHSSGQDGGENAEFPEESDKESKQPEHSVAQKELDSTNTPDTSHDAPKKDTSDTQDTTPVAVGQKKTGNTKLSTTKSKNIVHPSKIENKKEDEFKKELQSELKHASIVAYILALALLFFLLHFLLPVKAMHFLGSLGNGILYVSFIYTLSLLAFRIFRTGESIGSTSYTGILLFLITSMGIYFIRKKQMPNVKLTGLPLSIGLLVVWLGWGFRSLSSVQLPALGTATQYNALYSWSQIFFFMSFGVLLTTASWLFTSGYLGMLAKRGHGLGYGLEPKDWNEYQLQTSSIVFIAYPLFLLSTLTLSLHSLQTTGSLWSAFSLSPTRYGALFCLILLTGYLFSIRLPQKENLLNAFGNPTTKTNTFPSFLLLLTILTSAALFIGMQWSTLFVGK